MSKSNIPYCPLMSAGNDITIVCQQDRCAWYVNGAKTCAVYLLAHKAALDIRSKTHKENN